MALDLADLIARAAQGAFRLIGRGRDFGADVQALQIPIQVAAMRDAMADVLEDRAPRELLLQTFDVALREEMAADHVAPRRRRGRAVR